MTKLLSSLNSTNIWVHLVPVMEKAMAPHSSTLAWKIPWMEKAGRLQSMGSRRVGDDWVTSLSLFTFMRWRRKWQPTPVFLSGERIPGMGEPGGLPSMGSHRVRHDWSDLAAAATLYCFHPSLINNIKKYFYPCWSLLTKSTSLVTLVAFPAHIAFDFLCNVSLLEML